VTGVAHGVPDPRRSAAPVVPFGRGLFALLELHDGGGPGDLGDRVPRIERLRARCDESPEEPGPGCSAEPNTEHGRQQCSSEHPRQPEGERGEHTAADEPEQRSDGEPQLAGDSVIAIGDRQREERGIESLLALLASGRRSSTAPGTTPRRRFDGSRRFLRVFARDGCSSPMSLRLRGSPTP
jgi:hypothetical protein